MNILRGLLIIFVCLLLISCATSVNPKYYGYDSYIEKFDAPITIKPKLLESFKKTTTISYRNNYENRDLGYFGTEEDFVITEASDYFSVIVTSDFMDYECKFDKRNADIISGDVTRMDFDKLNLESLGDELSGLISDIEKLIVFDRETTCGYLQKFFIVKSYKYGEEFDDLSNQMLKNINMGDIAKSGVDLNKRNLSVKSIPLGLTDYKGTNCLLNGSSIKLHMPINVNNQTLNMGIAVKGFTLIVTDTGIPIVDDYRMTIKFNDTPVVTTKFATEISNIIFH